MAEKRKSNPVRTEEIVDYLMLKGDFSKAHRDLTIQKITATAARKAGLKVSDKELQTAADEFRRKNGLHKAGDIKAWLKATKISLEQFENFFEFSLLAEKFKDQLEKKAMKEKYSISSETRNSLKELIYKDWLSKNA